MVKSQTRYWIVAVGLIAFLGIVLFTLYTQRQRPESVFPATISRDCAPWDGAAFTIKIPIHQGAILDISIWQSPDIHRSITFSFPNETLQTGNVSLIPRFGQPEQLTGTVWFKNVREGMPIEGRFSLTSESGARLEAKFVAEWDDQIVYCG